MNNAIFFRFAKSSLTAIIIMIVSSIGSVQADTQLSPSVVTEGIACNILNTPNGKKRWSILQYDLS